MNQTPPDNAAAAIPLRWRLRGWLFRELFAAEYTNINQLQAVVGLQAREIERLTQELNGLIFGRRARFKLEGGLPDEQIARRLAGQDETPVMQAVMALIDAKIVEMADRATNPPNEVNTADLRTYEAGGANAIAEFKARLQEVTRPLPAKPEAVQA